MLDAVYTVKCEESPKFRRRMIYKTIPQAIRPPHTGIRAMNPCFHGNDDGVGSSNV